MRTNTRISPLLSLGIVILFVAAGVEGREDDGLSDYLSSVPVEYMNETYEFPPMKFGDLKRLFGVNGGYITGERFIYRDTDFITPGTLIVPSTARRSVTPTPLQDAFFERIKHRLLQGEKTYANTMLSYWTRRAEFLKTHFGKYVYFCNHRVHAEAPTADALEAIEHPCGDEIALVARVGAEIETSYTYRSGSATQAAVPEGSAIGVPVATMDFEVPATTTDRKQTDGGVFRVRFNNVVVDTGAEEINLMATDFPQSLFLTAREVSNKGLLGSGAARFVTLRAKFAEHEDFRLVPVLLNDDPIEHRIVGMRFLQHFHTIIGGPVGRWAAEPNQLAACAIFLEKGDVDILHDFLSKQQESAQE